jgi:isochorismate pyruvate lyase
MDEIDTYRSLIAELDEQIAELIATRLETAEIIGRLKKEAGLPIVNKDVEKQVIARFRGYGQAKGVDPDLMERIAKELIEAAVKREKEVTKGS